MLKFTKHRNRLAGWIDDNYTKGLVSVIIPTYNRAVFLKKTFMSVIEQTYRPLECIIVDDGSTDNTKEVLAELFNTSYSDCVCRVIFKENSGAPAARNMGTLASYGEFIQYLDSDDILYPDKIEKQAAFFNEHKNCDGVFGDWEAGTEYDKELVTVYKDDDMLTQMFAGKCIVNFSFLMRRSIVKSIGRWDETIRRNQEIDFHARGILEGARFHYLPGNTGWWRMHADDRIANKTSLISVIHFYKKWQNILSRRHLFSNKIKQGIINNYLWFLNQYAGYPAHEMQAVAKEIYLLNPRHQIFSSLKFRAVKLLFGVQIALRGWTYRFKKFKKSKRQHSQ